MNNYIARDMKKAIYYLSLASYHNEPSAQYLLGFIYKIGIGVPKNMIKGIDYFIQSASNWEKYAYFIVGYIYQEGKYVTRNMKKSIHYYKKASTMNNQYEKNNLGIIYKKGLDEEKGVNVGLAISYFDDSKIFSHFSWFKNKNSIQHCLFRNYYMRCVHNRFHFIFWKII